MNKSHGIKKKYKIKLIWKITLLDILIKEINKMKDKF